MSTADAVQPSWQNGKGSNDRLLPTAACSTNCGPSNSTTSRSQNLPYFTRLVVSKTLTTDSSPSTRLIERVAPVEGDGEHDAQRTKSRRCENPELLMHSV